MTISRGAPGSTGKEPARKGDRRPRNARAGSELATSKTVSPRRSGTSAPRGADRSVPNGAVDRARHRGGRATVESDGAPTDQRRRASAGRILAVGLLCFGLWLLFDANHLYQSAEAGQIGVRRSVAMSILRPIAAITNALRISGPVNAADTALGRCGAGAGSVCAPVPTIPSASAPPPAPQGYLGRDAAPHRGGPYVPPARSGPPPGPPALVSPTPAHPLTLLSIGDSIGEDLGFGLGDVFSTDSAVHVIQAGVESTGLSRSDYYNWPATLQADLTKYHPKILVVMLGANDAQPFYTGGGNYIPFGTTAWWQAYTARVGLVMQEATNAGAHVMWVGLPPMGPGSSVPAGFPQKLNRVFVAQTHTHPGVTYFSASSVLSSKTGGFTQYLEIDGTLEQIRYSDGVHLSPAGYDLLAHDLVDPMQHAWHVNLGVGF